jgi:hypothetical protein
VFKKPSKIVFYRGMRVLELPKPAAMTYDFTRSLTLTEDRTLAHPFMLQYYLAEEMGKCEDEAVVMAALRAASDSLESQIDWTSVSPTRTVIGAIGIIDRSAPGLLPIGARALMRVASRVDFVPELVTITGEQSDVLAEVQCRLQRTIGGDSASILLVRDTAIESGVMEHEGQVLMTLEAFDRWVGNKKEDREANDTTSRDVLRAAIEATGKSLERDDLLDLLVMCGRVWP